jgi:hypothetical protein
MRENEQTETENKARPIGVGVEPLVLWGLSEDEIEFLLDMKTYEMDHEPDGWPAVQMWKITMMLNIIERLVKQEDNSMPKSNCEAELRTIAQMRGDNCPDLSIAWKAAEEISQLKKRIHELETMKVQ